MLSLRVGTGMEQGSLDTMGVWVAIKRKEALEPAQFTTQTRQRHSQEEPSQGRAILEDQPAGQQLLPGYHQDQPCNGCCWWGVEPWKQTTRSPSTQQACRRTQRPHSPARGQPAPSPAWASVHSCPSVYLKCPSTLNRDMQRNRKTQPTQRAESSSEAGPPALGETLDSAGKKKSFRTATVNVHKAQETEAAGKNHRAHDDGTRPQHQGRDRKHKESQPESRRSPHTHTASSGQQMELAQEHDLEDRSPKTTQPKAQPAEELQRPARATGMLWEERGGARRELARTPHRPDSHTHASVSTRTHNRNPGPGGRRGNKVPCQDATGSHRRL